MTDKPTEPALLLSIDDAAKLLSLSRATVFKLLRTGQLESVSMGRRRLIPRAELERLIKERRSRRIATTQ